MWVSPHHFQMPTVPLLSSFKYKRGPEAGRETVGLAQVTRAHRGLLTGACWGFPKVSTERSKVVSLPLLEVGGWG